MKKVQNSQLTSYDQIAIQSLKLKGPLTKLKLLKLLPKPVITRLISVGVLESSVDFSGIETFTVNNDLCLEEKHK